MQKKYLFIPFIVLSFIFTPTTSILSPILAASPSPSPTQIDEAEATSNLKKRLQESLDLETATSSFNKAKAYVGMVTDVIKDTIIMQDKDGNKDIKLQDDTTIIRSPAGTTIKPENIRIDDYIIAIGYPGESEILLAKRLIVSVEEIKPPSKVSGLGTIAKIGKNSLTLNLEGQDQLISTTTKTIIKSSTGVMEYDDLAIGDTLIYTALVDDDDLTATVIMRVQTASIAE